MRRPLVLTAFVLLLLAPAALAHAPARLWPGEVFPLPDPKVSWALFGLFESGEELFVVAVDLDERFASPVEVMVPHRDELRDHRPAFAVVGPGLPTPSLEQRQRLPEALPAGWGLALLDLNEIEPRPVYFESFLRRFFWTSEPTAVVLPRGQSEVWIWSPRRTNGKFLLGVGVEEGGGYFEVFDDWSFYAY